MSCFSGFSGIPQLVMSVLFVPIVVLGQPSPADPGLASDEPDEHASFREGVIVVKLRPGALSVVPLGDESAALDAVKSSGLGITAGIGLENIIRTYGLRFERPLFTVPGKEAIARQSADARRNDWFDYATDLQIRHDRLGAHALTGAVVPDLSQVYVVRVPPELTVEAAVALSQDPHIEYAHLDYEIHVSSTPLPPVSYIPNDEFVTQDDITWNDGAWGQSYPDLWGVQRTQTLEAWNIFADPQDDPGAGIVVAVVDTGVDYNHPDIRNNIWINPGEDINGNGLIDGTNTCPTPNGDFNCQDNDGNGYVDDLRGWDFRNGDNNPIDDNRHGTHVSGTIAATADNLAGITGIAPNARIMPLKVFDNTGNANCLDVIPAIQYLVDQGAEVSNHSWSRTDFGNFISGGCPGVGDAFEFAYSMGSVTVVSAGNDGRNVSTAAPAGDAHVITVPALSEVDGTTFFSNEGSEMDVGAPGGGSDGSRNILSLLANGVSCVEPPISTRYCRLSGTSMSAPHVAGAVAVILSRFPNLSVEQVRQALRVGADDVLGSGWDDRSGFGRLNVFRSVGLAPQAEALITNVQHEQTIFDQTTITATATAPTGLSHAWTMDYRSVLESTWHVIDFGAFSGSANLSRPFNLNPLARGGYLLRFRVQGSQGTAVDVRRVFNAVYQNISNNLPAELSDRNRNAVGSDVDRDGDLDLVKCDQIPAASQPNDGLMLWINNGVGSFSDATSSRLPFDHDGVCSIALAVDVDGDSDDDIFLVRNDLAGGAFAPDQRAELYINDGQGFFTNQTASRLPTVSSTTALFVDSAAGDIDADSDMDIIVTGSSPAALINNGSGVFTNQVGARIPWVTSNGARGAHLIDLDGDGDLDFIYPGGVGINNGSGFFTQTRGGFSAALDVGDVTGDNRPDVVSGATLYVNNGSGIIPTSGTPLLSSDACLPSPSIIDIDLDGDQDLLLPTLQIVPNVCRQQVAVLLNNGSGTFVDGTFSIWGQMLSRAQSNLFFGDLTGEGYPELLVLSFANEPKKLLKPRWDLFPPSCVGDCNGGGSVAINELQRAVSITLTQQPVTNCRAADADGNGTVEVSEVIEAVNRALGGCAPPTGSFAQMLDRITIGTGEGVPGASVTIPISVVGSGGLMAGVQLDIVYDKDVFSINPSSECTIASRLSSSHQFGASSPSSPLVPIGKKRMRILVYPRFDVINTFTDGQVASCTFHITSSAAAGSYLLDGERQLASDVDGDELGLQAQDGSITVCGGCGCS